MTLRLLAYNTDTWLADHSNAYLQDPNEYRAITRSLMHHSGTITYTPETITVTLDPHGTPRVNRALACLTDELNTTPAHMPGDPPPDHLPTRDMIKPQLTVIAYFRSSGTDAVADASRRDGSPTSAPVCEARRIAHDQSARANRALGKLVVPALGFDHNRAAPLR